jgi:asparagine synthase (glutamine-hydrolysing)
MYYFFVSANCQENSNRYADGLKNLENILHYEDKNYQAVCVTDPKLSEHHFSPQISRENKGIIVVFEGCITNYKELIQKNRIKLSKHDFTKLIQELYLEKEIDFINALKGSYSFVVVDKNKDKIILHRSSDGIKPLYYYWDSTKLIASTYLKALLKQPLIKKEINWTRIYSYFMVDGLSLNNDTEYKNVYNLTPGEILVLEKEGLHRKRLRMQKKYELVGQKKEKVIDSFYSIIRQAHKNIFDQCSSIGIAFSGGLDTNIILALASEEKAKTSTYTIKYQTKSDTKHKDFQTAKERAKEYRVDHVDIDFSPEQFIEHLNNALSQLERVFTLPELNTLLIFKLLSQYNNIILSGDASEEQLGLMNMQIFGFWADKLVQALPAHNAIDLSRSFINNYYNLLFWRGWGWHYQLRDEKSLRESIFTPDCEAKVKQVDLYKIFAEAYRQSPDSSFFLDDRSIVPSLFNKILWLDLKNFVLPNKALASDLGSRLYSVSSFFPYLDNNFVNFASEIPAEMKLKTHNEINGTKYIFRQAVAGLVGEKNAFPGWKSGSDIPLVEWFVNPKVRNFIEETLQPSRIKKYGIINSEYVSRILKEHYHDIELKYSNSDIVGKSGIDHTHKIGKLLCFQKWIESNFD